MRMRRAIAAFSILVLALGVLACTSTRSGKKLPVDRIRPGESTKAEVIGALGAPNVLRNRGEDQILTYRFAEGTGRGGGIGISRFGLFVIEHIQIGRDTLNVVVGPDQKVRYFYFNLQSDKTHARFWPFGS